MDVGADAVSEPPGRNRRVHVEGTAVIGAVRVDAERHRQHEWVCPGVDGEVGDERLVEQGVQLRAVGPGAIPAALDGGAGRGGERLGHGTSLGPEWYVAKVHSGAVVADHWRIMGDAVVSVTLDRDATEPLPTQLARRLRGLVADGVLRRGQRLPSTRS